MRTAPIDFLHECFLYEQETGVLRWRVRPRSHFNTDRGYRVFHSNYAGKDAGGLANGYLMVRMGCYGYARVHRVIIAMTQGAWPEMVDHINGDTVDNRLSNLRACTKSENCKNRKMNASNRSGFKGVSRKPSVRRWQARIQVDGKQIHLGMFDTPDLAHAAYAAASKQHHGAFANAG